MAASSSASMSPSTVTGAGMRHRSATSRIDAASVGSEV